MAKGTDVKFPGKPCEKISGNEGQTIYIQIDVEGDPPPKVEWFKVNHNKIRFIVYSYVLNNNTVIRQFSRLYLLSFILFLNYYDI